MLHAGVDDDDVASVEGPRVSANGHLELALEHVHELLGVLVRVPWHLGSGLVADAAEQHLLAADRLEGDAREQRQGLAAVHALERRGGAHSISRKPAPPLLDTAASEMSSSKIIRLPSRRGCALAWIARSTRSGVAGYSVTHAPTASWIAAAMAAGWALLAISPIALAPNGPSIDGFSRITFSKSGRSSSDGAR